MSTFNEIWNEYLAAQAERRAQWNARRESYEAARAEHDANLHWCGLPRPIQIGACCPAEAYEADSAMGRNTD